MDWPERAKHGLARESCLFRELFTAVELAVFTVERATGGEAWIGQRERSMD